MAKQHENRTKTSQHCFRLTEAEAIAMERFARNDGHLTIASWAAALVHQRALVLEKHFADGTYATVRDMAVPWNEIPGLDPNECRLTNVEHLLSLNPEPDSQDDTALKWLIAAYRTTNNPAHKQRAIALAKSLHVSQYAVFKREMREDKRGEP